MVGEVMNEGLAARRRSSPHRAAHRISELNLFLYLRISGVSLGGRVLVGLTFTIDPFLTSIFSCSNLEPTPPFKCRQTHLIRMRKCAQESTSEGGLYVDSLETEMLSPVPPGDWYMPRSTKVVKEDLPEALTKPLD